MVMRLGRYYHVCGNNYSKLQSLTGLSLNRPDEQDT